MFSRVGASCVELSFRYVWQSVARGHNREKCYNKTQEVYELQGMGLIHSFAFEEVRLYLWMHYGLDE